MESPNAVAGGDEIRDEFRGAVDVAGDRFDPAIAPRFEGPSVVRVAIDQVSDDLHEWCAQVAAQVLGGREHLCQERFHFGVGVVHLREEVSKVPVDDDTAEVEHHHGDGRNAMRQYRSRWISSTQACGSENWKATVAVPSGDAHSTTRKS